MLEEMAEKELEEQVLEAGNKLLKVPADVDELLALLDKVEGLLSKVEQSPIKSMQNALSPTMNALVSSELLSHKNTDVKVSVAACVSEITRITAPEAPYNDDQMKQIFQVIVESFEMLGDNFCRSYEKRVSILETVAKVRSCVVMLDLECDGLILQMFNYFLKAIRDHHTENVFTSMETIMSLVLEESEEISPPLLHPLLTSVKKEDQAILPVARKLGEKVLGNCSAKLKPYLMDAIKSMGMSPNDYSKIVASICQETSDTAEHNDDSVSGEHLAEERSLPEMIDSEKPLQLTEELNPEAVCQTEVGLEKSPKAVTSNGDAQNVNDDLSAGVDSTKEEENCQPSSQVAEVEPVPLDPKISESETMRDEPVKKKRGRKPNVSVQTPETSGQSKVEGDTETDLPVQGRSSDSKEDDTSPSEEQSVNKSAVLSVPEKEVVEQVTLPTAPRDEPVKVASPSSTKNLPDGGRAKRGRPARVKKGNLKEDTDHGSPSVLKEALSSEHVESDAVVSADAVSKVGSEGELKTEEKMNEQVAKKELSDKEKSDGATSDSEEKPLKRSSKKVDMKDNKDEGSSAKKEGEKAKRGRPKSLPGKDLAGESSNKKTGSSLKPPEKSTSEKETPSTKSKRKRTPAKETSENKDHGEDLVGSLIRVWWPDDKKFYQGVVDSFDPSSNKHKISYIDGDEEILLLKEERWKLVEDHTVANKGQSTDPSSPDASSEMPQKKKAKANSASGSNLAKTNTPSNKGKEISASKSKVEATKSSRRSKNDGKKAGDSTSKSAAGANNDNIGKSKGSTPKSGTKAKDDSPKTGTKSKVDTPKIGTKSKDATPKTGTKSKDETPKAETKSEDDTAKTRTKSKKETPKTGSKAKANGTSAKGKDGPSRGEETDTVEGKAHESETKSGRKRRR